MSNLTTQHDASCDMLRKLLLIAAMTFGLSGCWMSQEDLFADQYLSDSGFEGEYTYNFNELNPSRRVSITTVEPGVLSMYEHDAVNYPATTTELRTLELGQGYFLIARPANTEGYQMGYALARKGEDGAIVQYGAPCEDWIANQPGTSRDPENPKICAFRSFSALEAASLSAIRRGSLKPETIYQPVTD